MCDSRGRQTRDWRPFVRDMIEFGERVLLYTVGLEQDAFVNDMRTYDAVLRNLELIGEAATHIPGHVRSAHPDIDWRSVIAARNRVAHGYSGIDDDVIWDIVRTDIPDLLPKLRRMLDSAQNVQP